MSRGSKTGPVNAPIALGGTAAADPPSAIGAFTGPVFDPRDIAAHLASWRIGRVPAG